MQVLTNVNLNKNQLENAVIQNLAVEPVNAVEGQIYYNTTTHQCYQYKVINEIGKWEPIGAPYTLPIASADKLGGIKVGTGLGIAEDGKLYVTGDATVNSVEWSVVQNTPTTIAGYGITDAKVDTSKKSVTIGNNTLSNLVSDASYIHTDNNFTTSEKQKLEGIDTAALANKIETISVNKQNVAAVGKNVDITVPTKVGQLQNDKNYITAGQAPVQSVNGETGAVALDAAKVGALSSAGGTMTGAIAMGSHKISGLADGSDPQDAVTKKQMEAAVKALGTVFDFKGSKKTVSEIKALTGAIGDVWYAEDEKVGYIWINDSSSSGRWEQLGPTVDLTGYLTKAGLLTSTGDATNNTMTQKAITDAIKLKADATTVNAIPKLQIKTGTIASSQQSVSVSYTGTLVNTFAKTAKNNERVLLDEDLENNTVTFSTAQPATENITCTVLYY